MWCSTCWREQCKGSKGREGGVLWASEGKRRWRKKGGCSAQSSRAAGCYNNSTLVPPSLCSSSLITLSSFAPCCHLARYASPSCHLSHSSTPRSPQNSPSPLLHLHVLVAPSLRARGKKNNRKTDHLLANKSPLPVSVGFTFVSVCRCRLPRVTVSRQRSSHQVFVSKKTRKRENKRRSLLSLLFYILLSFLPSSSFPLFLPTSTNTLQSKLLPSSLSQNQSLILAINC